MWREVDGEVILLDPAGWNYLGINDSGAELWPLVVGGTDVERMTDRLVAVFDVPRPTAERDVAAFVQRLAELELLAHQPSPS